MNGSPLHVIHGDQVFPGIEESPEQMRRRIIRRVTVPRLLCLRRLLAPASLPTLPCVCRVLGNTRSSTGVRAKGAGARLRRGC